MKTLTMLIQKFGIPQKRLAEILGISTGVLNRYLNGNREPGLAGLRIINQAEALLDQALLDAKALPLPKPDAEHIKRIKKNLLEVQYLIVKLENNKQEADNKLNQTRLVLAWLSLWEQSGQHPQKPWSADFVQAQKGFSTIQLGQHLEAEILAFDLDQAQKRASFLEKLIQENQPD